MPVKEFHWGIESWQQGSNDFVIRFDGGPVSILRVKGIATAAPQPNHQPYSQMIRQALATLINVEAPAEPTDVHIVSTPESRANQSVSAHLFSLNVKQLNGAAVVIPFDFSYQDCPVVLAHGVLMMNILNESYKMQDSAAIVSKDQHDALNLEMHIRVTYERPD